MTEEQEQRQQAEIERAKKPTESQLRILEYMANGLKPAEVSQVVGVKEDTVRKHLEAVTKRLRVPTVERAVAIAVKQGWVRVDDYPRS